MDTDKSEILEKLFDGKIDKINQITEKIIGCSFTISNVLGCGFLEKVYENALAHELRKSGFKVLQQYEIEVSMMAWQSENIPPICLLKI